MAQRDVSLGRPPIPWWAKMGAKLLLARLPVDYERWRRLGLFRHGAMLDVDYATSVFERHFAPARELLRPGFTALELGPGDSLATAVLASAYGARRTYLIDVGPFADRSTVAPYNALAAALTARGLPPRGAPYADVASMLSATNAIYLTEGLRSLTGLDAESVDFAFSHAVLEHVRLTEFDRTIRELHRVQTRDGVSSHRVDLQDHLSHSLNSLRFSTAFWESPIVASSGFYTNRLRAPAIIRAFVGAGYRVRERSEDRWARLPLARSRFHRDFQQMPIDDLLPISLDLLAQK